ncbi:hypothetical protein CCHR01_16558 [Colletotrichum chrysophilum]|uniref:Uncharacterized protein n=1 Tax=Colletotrichum chrysophilum TaxID=1836956 RepID=A0AAD9A452_9PEZI|nr:hypothetical protein CCHR01_16558 [Colletotrichum chrysophilum]
MSLEVAALALGIIDCMVALAPRATTTPSENWKVPTIPTPTAQRKPDLSEGFQDVEKFAEIFNRASGLEHPNDGIVTIPNCVMEMRGYKSELFRMELEEGWSQERYCYPKWNSSEESADKVVSVAHQGLSQHKQRVGSSRTSSF